MQREDKPARGAAFERSEKVLTMQREDRRGRGAAFERSEKVLTMQREDRRGRGAALRKQSADHGIGSSLVRRGVSDGRNDQSATQA